MGVVLTCFMPQGWSLVAGGLLLALQVRSTGWDRFLCVLALPPVCSSVAGGGGWGGGPTAPVGRPAPSREFCASLVASSRESVQTQSGSSTGRGGPLPLTSGAVLAVLGPHPPAALGVLLAPSWHWLYQAALSCLWSPPQVTAFLCGVSGESSSRQSLATRSPYGGCLRRACLGPPCTPASCLLASLFAPQDASRTLSWGDLMLARWPRCRGDGRPGAWVAGLTGSSAPWWHLLWIQGRVPRLSSRAPSGAGLRGRHTLPTWPLAPIVALLRERPVRRGHWGWVAAKTFSQVLVVLHLVQRSGPSGGAGLGRALLALIHVGSGALEVLAHLPRLAQLSEELRWGLPGLPGSG